MRVAALVPTGLLVMVAAVANGPAPITYENPPERLIWLEGEDCPEHNWTLGPQFNCWAFGWAGVHGGVLDLASWACRRAMLAC